MTRSPSRWDDLGPRLMTSAGLIVIGTAVVWLGGIWFTMTIAAAAGIMIWEMARMITPDRPGEAMQIGFLAAASVLLVRVLPPAAALPVLGAAVLVGVLRVPAHRRLYAVYGVFILVAAAGLVTFRDAHGMLWLIWLILVVVVTDVFGYFGGKLIGGRKFWPRISPKKTWAGVVSGWIAAGLVGMVFTFFTTAGFDLIWITMLVSFASQMGDIAESAIKRRMGVKDSSALLPGHGGLWDRFDALLGASLMMLFFKQIYGVPVVIY